LLSGRAITGVIVLGVVAGISALYVELLTRLPARQLFNALVELSWVGAAVLVAGAFGVSRASRGSTWVMLAGILWIAAAAGYFAFVVAVCASCMA